MAFKMGVLGLVFGLVQGLLCGAGYGQKKAPNVLFLLTDDQRADAIGAYGNRFVRTPAIDSLVASGMSFTRSYCMGSWSGAVCMPSRSMIMSGRSLWRSHGRLKGCQTFPEAFRNAGYQTFGTGKWHASRESFERSFEQGSAVFLGGMSRHEAVPSRELIGGKLQAKAERRGFSSTLFADAAISFLKGRNRDRPFMAYVSFTAPHDPRTPPASWSKVSEASKIKLPANFKSKHPFPNGEMTIRDEKLLGWPRTKEAVQRELACYYELISHMDFEIGRILAALEASGEAANTLVIFASDHGLAIGSHGLLGKQNPYEHSIRAPLILSGPGIPKGRSSDALCYLLDIYPTAAELSGLPVPLGIFGKSLAPVIQGNTTQHRKSIYNAYRHIQRALIGPRYKLILHRVDGVETCQLFDLQKDPDELMSLSTTEAGAQRASTMKSQLNALQGTLGDNCFGNRKRMAAMIRELKQ